LLPVLKSLVFNAGISKLYGEADNQVPEKLRSEIHSDRVFIVHGHDNEMKLAARDTIRSLGLIPVILHEETDKGRTVIEKFEEHSDVGFAIVLLSPDDMAYPENSSPEDAKPRARQNVILEMGFFLGKLGRENTFLLRRENVELPSDSAGILYNIYDDPYGTWRNKLVKELFGSGYKVTADDL
jgi:predicted nucleotide-binding protein